MHVTHNSMTVNSRVQSVERLNRHLATAIDLHAQVKHAHWNVRGPGFIAIHELFDRIATAVNTHADLIAERAGALGGQAEGTIQTAAANSVLTPYPLGIADQHKHIFAVAAALAAFGDGTRTAIADSAGWGDAVTADLFTRISGEIDALLWLVESHQGPQ